MDLDPLHLHPIKPRATPDGSLTNPIGPTPIGLDPTRPLPYADLRPSSNYSDGRFEYLTDHNAMPARVRGVLELRPRGEVVRHARVQAEIGRLSTATGRWQGGHIVAVSLGGFASGPNLFPQSGNFNQSAYARLEQGWRASLRHGATVCVDIALTEGTDPVVPEFVIVTCWENEAEYTIPLLNEPRAQ